MFNRYGYTIVARVPPGSFSPTNELSEPHREHTTKALRVDLIDLPSDESLPESSYSEDTAYNVFTCKPSRTGEPSLDEEARKKQRRERNKQAASRCRQRRIEYTNKLAYETQLLEMVNNELQSTLTALLSQRDHLIRINDNH